MLAFKIFLNDEKLCVAGLAGMDLISILITSMTHGVRVMDGAVKTPVIEKVGIVVGGIEKETRGHVRWCGEKSLSIGDRIRVEIANAEQADPVEKEKAKGTGFQRPEPRRLRMNGFEVFVNGVKQCVAGVHVGVLSSSLTMHSRPESEEESDRAESITLMVGGLESENEPNKRHLDWIYQALALGDIVDIRLIATDQADPPMEERPFRGNIN